MLAVIFDVMAQGVTAVARVPRGPAIGLSVLALITLFVGVFALFGTQLAREFDTILESIPPALTQVDGLLSRFKVGQSARELFDRGTSDISRLMSQAGG